MSSVLQPARETTSARPYVQAAFLTMIAVLLFAPTLIDLFKEWITDEGSSYGILVPPLSFYIAWKRKHLTVGAIAEEDTRGVFVVAAGCLMFLIGNLGAEFFLSRMSSVVVLTGLILTFWGAKRLKTLAFPLILLATMVPLPTLVYNKIGIPLQLFASAVSTSLIQLTGASAYRDGNIIQLPQITLGVAEACSGLRSLSSLCIAALLVGFLLCGRIRTRFALFVLAIPLAIGVNVLRITGTALIAVHRQDLAMGFYHSFSGWLTFVTSLLILFAIGKGLMWAFE